MIAMSHPGKTHMKLLAATLIVWVLVMSAVVAGQNVSPRRQTPATPAPVRSILHAQRFTLETPFQSTWSKDRPMVSSGVLLVLDVDPAYVVPRNAMQPVLYAGDFTVERLNTGYPSGKVIGIVPGNLDLTTAPVWFGPPQLPERVTASMVQEERARAERAGVRALPQATVSTAERSPVAAKDLATLLRNVVSQLVYQYSPKEKQLADSWRRPDAKAPARQPN
jgi:hypothetical protein